MIGTEAQFARSLLDWYDVYRRDLPWRMPKSAGPSTGLVNPYFVLVSEAMLQQTQVATVIPYFHRFIAEFPTVDALAEADEQAVLRAWQGLGYYSRARNLHKAAKYIMAQHGGWMPATVEELLLLPGVGLYTAGAISSIAYDERAPILDGNVERVLCRIDAIETDPRERLTRAALWRRAEDILPQNRVGDFNSALMELGALVCVPRTPQCLTCPVATQCSAAAAGIQTLIPPVRKAKATPLLQRWTFAIGHQNKWLIEQRPATGRWAGMWQVVTLKPDGDRPAAELISSAFSIDCGPIESVGIVTHTLTHRRYKFELFSTVAERVPADVGPRVWADLATMEKLPMSKPQLKMRGMIS